MRLKMMQFCPPVGWLFFWSAGGFISLTLPICWRLEYTASYNEYLGSVGNTGAKKLQSGITTDTVAVSDNGQDVKCTDDEACPENMQIGKNKGGRPKKVK